MSNDMDDLKELWRIKAIDAATFTQMAKELQQAEQLARPPQEPAPPPQRRSLPTTRMMI